MIDGKRHSLTYDHDPTKRELERDVAKLRSTSPVDKRLTFKKAAESYIDMKKNILSPSTIRSYNTIINNAIPESFLKKALTDLTAADVQILINDHSKTHKPKTTRNLHGFVSAVVGMFRPELMLHTTLPRKAEFKPYVPSNDDIKKILDASSKDPGSHIPFQLGVMGLRRGEICALTLEDINGTELSINKSLVRNDNKEWVIKELTKTEAGMREIYIPKKLVKEIKKNGFFYTGTPNNLVKKLNRYQDQLQIPRFRFHDLRHFFASYAHSVGMSDADIMASGGWKSDYTMKTIYRHEMNAREGQKKLFDALL